MPTLTDQTALEARSILQARTLTLQHISARLQDGHPADLPTLRRAWSLTRHGPLQELDASAVGAQLLKRSDNTAGAEDAWVHAFLVQEGALCADVLVPCRATAERCGQDARALLDSAREGGGTRSVLICVSAWYGIRDRPTPGQDPDDFAFAEAAGEWSGFRLI